MQEDIVTIARSYIGVRFRHQGRNRAGIDCVGLLVCVAKELNVKYYDQTAYKRRTNGSEFIAKFRAAGFKEKHILDRQVGDILVIEEDKSPCHVAILANKSHGETIIHAFASRRQVVEEPYSCHWKLRTVSCFEFPKAGA